PLFPYTTLFRSKQSERNVRDHPREVERPRDDPELPVGERSAARDIGEDRGKGAAGDEIGKRREAEQSGQRRHEAFYGKPLPDDRGHDPAGRAGSRRSPDVRPAARAERG